MDKEQLLYQYFSNGLTPEQERRFNELLDTDSEFREQFDFEKDLQNVIRDKQSNDLKTKLVGFETDIADRSTAISDKESNLGHRKSASSDQKPVRTLPNTNYQKWAIAASIALLVGLGWLGFNNLSGPNYGDLYQDNFQDYPNTVYTITRSDEVVSIERDAFAAYEAGNYETALENFDRITQEDQKPYLNFYRAQSYLQLNNLEEAQKLFEKNIRNGGNFVAESHWYLALTCLKKKEKARAISALEKLTSDYDYNRDKAQDLLNQLR